MFWRVDEIKSTFGGPVYSFYGRIFSSSERGLWLVGLRGEGQLSMA